MGWYLLNIFIVTVLWLAIKDQKNPNGTISKQYNNININFTFCVIASLLWIFLSGFRDISVGSDTASYKIDFDATKYYSWEYLFKEFPARYIYDNARGNDPGYGIFQKIVHIFSDNYQFYLVFVAICFFSVFGYFIYKNSKNVYLSFIMFSCLFFEFFAITGTRQTLATILVNFVGYELIKKKKWFWYIVVILIGMTLHTSAICVLPFYWLCKIKINKPTLVCYWIAIAMSFVYRNQLLIFLKDLMDNDKYDGYNQYSSTGVGTFMYLLLAVGVVVTIFYKKIIEAGGDRGKHMIHGILVACFFSSLLFINPSFMRVVQYFSIYLVLLVPELECILKTEHDKQIYRIAATALLVLLLIRKNPYYTFCFFNY